MSMSSGKRELTWLRLDDGDWLLESFPLLTLLLHLLLLLLLLLVVVRRRVRRRGAPAPASGHSSPTVRRDSRSAA